MTDIARELADLCIDYDGSQIVDGAETRSPVSCRQVRAVLAALSTARLEGERAGMERAATYVEQALGMEEDALSEAASDIFNASYTKPMVERIDLLGKHLAAAIRAEKDGLK